MFRSFLQTSNPGKQNFSKNTPHMPGLNSFAPSIKICQIQQESLWEHSHFHISQVITEAYILHCSCTYSTKSHSMLYIQVTEM